MGTTDKEELLKGLEKYLEDLKQLHKTNPELAKKKAKEALQRTGMLDKKGNFLPPYNSQSRRFYNGTWRNNISRRNRKIEK